MIAKKPRPRKSDHTEELLDEALKETFPASDPPALVEPGGGITGTEDGQENAPDQRTTKKPPNKERTERESAQVKRGTP
jgi:hypothetical protein